ncbi:MAG TPA: PEPxxWA-CTERM sorting domain-containing protein [Phenylobacterium sp.]|nr:PEPxxWA-CTERM sorting domain-containing protein [Phenylobacterium sp.]
MRKSIATLAGLLALAAAAGQARAATVSQTLGTVVQVGGGPVASGDVFASSAFAGSADPAPFDLFNGLDGSGPDFSAGFTFNYAAPGGPVDSGLLVLGLYDGDTAAPGDQLALFTLNGIDLTSSLNAVFEATPSSNSQEVFYSLVLPSAVYSQLATGAVTIGLDLKGPGLGVLGQTAHNGAVLDFATLTVGSRDTGPSPTPEPAAWGLMILGFGLAGAGLRRGAALRGV